MKVGGGDQGGILKQQSLTERDFEIQVKRFHTREVVLCRKNDLKRAFKIYVLAEGGRMCVINSWFWAGLVIPSLVICVNRSFFVSKRAE